MSGLIFVLRIMASVNVRCEYECIIIFSQKKQWCEPFTLPYGHRHLQVTQKSDKMEIKRLKKALEEREAAGFDGFEGSGMRIATITAVARAFNNAGRRQPAPTSQGESFPSTP